MKTYVGNILRTHNFIRYARLGLEGPPLPQLYQYHLPILLRWLAYIS